MRLFKRFEPLAPKLLDEIGPAWLQRHLEFRPNRHSFCRIRRLLTVLSLNRYWTDITGYYKVNWNLNLVLSFCFRWEQIKKHLFPTKQLYNYYEQRIFHLSTFYFLNSCGMQNVAPEFQWLLWWLHFLSTHFGWCGERIVASFLR